MTQTQPKTIILTGGGTGGSVTPLLALVDNFKDGGYEVVWIGTHHGLEEKMVEEAGLSYYSINSGKWRRYFSLQNIIDLFKILIGLCESFVILHRLKPSLVMTAGGFVSVPVVWAAWILGYPIIVHQQDIKPGLANRLMAPLATRITVTFEKSLEDYGKKAIQTGNPVRKEFKEVKLPLDQSSDKQILIMGGGTGSEAINMLVREELSELTSLASVTHITGEKNHPDNSDSTLRYTSIGFLSAKKMAESMARADVIVSRAGLGTLTELAYLGKASILIPMPYSHQEDNARYAEEKKAVVVLHQQSLTAAKLFFEIKVLLEESEKRAQLEHALSNLMPKDANERVYHIAREIIEKED